MIAAALTRPAAASHHIQGFGWAVFGTFASMLLVSIVLFNMEITHANIDAAVSGLYLMSELPREGGQIDAARRRFQTAKQQQEARGMASAGH